MSFLPGKSLQDVALSELEAVGIKSVKGKDGLKDWMRKQEAAMQGTAEEKQGLDANDMPIKMAPPTILSHSLGNMARWIGPDGLLTIWKLWQSCFDLVIWLELSCVDVLSKNRLLTQGGTWERWREDTRRQLAAKTTVAMVKKWMHSLLTVTGYEIFISKGGLFNADPHPGNILVLPDGRLGLIDYGQCKRLNEDIRQKFAKLLLLVQNEGSDQEIAAAFRATGLITKKVFPCVTCYQ